MDPEKLGDDTYAALVDMRGEIEVLSAGMNRVLALLLFGMPEEKREPMIKQIEQDLLNHRFPDEHEDMKFRQYFVHLSMVIESKAKKQSQNLRTIMRVIEARNSAN